MISTEHFERFVVSFYGPSVRDSTVHIYTNETTDNDSSANSFESISARLAKYVGKAVGSTQEDVLKGFGQYYVQRVADLKGYADYPQALGRNFQEAIQIRPEASGWAQLYCCLTSTHTGIINFFEGAIHAVASAFCNNKLDIVSLLEEGGKDNTTSEAAKHTAVLKMSVPAESLLIRQPARRQHLVPGTSSASSLSSPENVPNPALSRHPSSTAKPLFTPAASFFHELFPFHFIVDKECKVLQVGLKLVELLPDLGSPEALVWQSLKICCPSTEWDFDAIMKLLSEGKAYPHEVHLEEILFAPPPIPLTETAHQKKAVLSQLDQASHIDDNASSDKKPGPAPAVAPTTSIATTVYPLRLKGQFHSVDVAGTAALLFMGSVVPAGIQEMQERGLYLSDFTPMDFGRERVLLEEKLIQLQVNLQQQQADFQQSGAQFQADVSASAPCQPLEAHADLPRMLNVGAEGTSLTSDVPPTARGSSPGGEVLLPALDDPVATDRDSQGSLQNRRLETPAEMLGRVMESLMTGQEISLQEMMEAQEALSYTGSLHTPVHLRQQIMSSGVDNEVGLSLINMFQETPTLLADDDDDDEEEEEEDGCDDDHVVAEEDEVEVEMDPHTADHMPHQVRVVGAESQQLQQKSDDKATLVSVDHHKSTSVMVIPSTFVPPETGGTLACHSDDPTASGADPSCEELLYPPALDFLGRPSYVVPTLMSPAPMMAQPPHQPSSIMAAVSPFHDAASGLRTNRDPAGETAHIDTSASPHLLHLRASQELVFPSTDSTPHPSGNHLIIGSPAIYLDRGMSGEGIALDSTMGSTATGVLSLQGSGRAGSGIMPQSIADAAMMTTISSRAHSQSLPYALNTLPISGSAPQLLILRGSHHPLLMDSHNSSYSLQESASSIAAPAEDHHHSAANAANYVAAATRIAGRQAQLRPQGGRLFSVSSTGRLRRLSVPCAPIVDPLEVALGGSSGLVISQSMAPAASVVNSLPYLSLENVIENTLHVSNTTYGGLADTSPTATTSAAAAITMMNDNTANVGATSPSNSNAAVASPLQAAMVTGSDRDIADTLPSPSGDAEKVGFEAVSALALAHKMQDKQREEEAAALQSKAPVSQAVLMHPAVILQAGRRNANIASGGIHTSAGRYNDYGHHRHADVDSTDFFVDVQKQQEVIVGDFGMVEEGSDGSDEATDAAAAVIAFGSGRSLPRFADVPVMPHFMHGLRPHTTAHTSAPSNVLSSLNPAVSNRYDRGGGGHASMFLRQAGAVAVSSSAAPGLRRLERGMTQVSSTPDALGESQVLYMMLISDKAQIAGKQALKEQPRLVGSRMGSDGRPANNKQQETAYLQTHRLSVRPLRHSHHGVLSVCSSSSGAPAVHRQLARGGTVAGSADPSSSSTLGNNQLARGGTIAGSSDPSSSSTLGNNQHKGEIEQQGSPNSAEMIHHAQPSPPELSSHVNSQLTGVPTRLMTKRQQQVFQERRISLNKEPSDRLNILLERVDEWQYDMFALEDVTQSHALSVLGFALLKRTEVYQKFKMDESRLAKFLMEIEEGYSLFKGQHYHCSTHAADVLRTLHVLMTRGGLSRNACLPDLGVFAMYLAAIVHDYGHKGVNNDFLIKTHDMLALQYNDRSPMENYHASASWMLLRQEEYNFWRKMPQKSVEAVRKLVIDVVLSTDMKQHFTLVSHFNAKVGCAVTTLHAPKEAIASSFASISSLRNSGGSYSRRQIRNAGRASSGRLSRSTSNRLLHYEQQDVHDVDTDTQYLVGEGYSSFFTAGGNFSGIRSSVQLRESGERRSRGSSGSAESNRSGTVNSHNSHHMVMTGRGGRFGAARISTERLIMRTDLMRQQCNDQKVRNSSTSGSVSGNPYFMISSGGDRPCWAEDAAMTNSKRGSWINLDQLRHDHDVDKNSIKCTSRSSPSDVAQHTPHASSTMAAAKVAGMHQDGSSGSSGGTNMSCQGIDGNQVSSIRGASSSASRNMSRHTAVVRQRSTSLFAAGHYPTTMKARRSDHSHYNVGRGGADIAFVSGGSSVGTTCVSSYASSLETPTSGAAGGGGSFRLLPVASTSPCIHKDMMMTNIKQAEHQLPVMIMDVTGAASSMRRKPHGSSLNRMSSPLGSSSMAIKSSNAAFSGGYAAQPGSFGSVVMTAVVAGSHNAAGVNPRDFPSGSASCRQHSEAGAELSVRNIASSQQANQGLDVLLADALDEEGRLLVLQMALKWADIGHLASPREVHLRWVKRLEEEMFRQGDKERAHGLPISPLMDRRKGQGITKSQTGFFNFVALPMYRSMADAFPSCSPLLEAVKENYEYWSEKEKQ
ncbi:hypothetical protein CEUSTIGMA_g13178.t1 [Chlamydomonas eustigma]|uniref:Phosphodiesterase n=1 Tax=Chlamydomonas eustigma TaxID=1157962 RepID=A0A250XRW9_9CHLO|nr:hypothetical protein CEUSTIGMA_g13178.t1 [Chlamydomonas eustigma]|eukprot:GAX85763.1 hypothetical protein CEUSTIGMA_g13178.t1 [Chlamydomonas eustigma]